MKYPVSSGDAGRLKAAFGSSGKKLLYYHEDCDGICSASLLMKVFPGFTSRPREGPRMEADFVQGIVNKKPKVLVFLDLPVDQEWENMLYIRKELPDSDILVIDHHIPERDMNSDGITHINPKFHSDSYIPASCMMYRVLEGMGFKEEQIIPLLWIACVGIIGDYGFSDCGDFLDRCRKLHRGSLSKDPKKSRLARCAEMITAAITMYGLKGAKRVLEIVLQTDEYQDLLKNRELLGWKSGVKKEFERVLGEFKKESVFHKRVNLVAFEIRSPMNLTSLVASGLSEKYPNRIIMIRKKSRKGGYKISARYQDGKVDIGSLFKKCVKGIGSGGGHVKAAGALINDYSKFEKCVIRELEKDSSRRP